MAITYEKAALTLRAYKDWINSQQHPGTHCRRPKDEDLNAAIDLSISLLGQVIRGDIPTPPAALRLQALEEAIQRFLYDNR